jgi:membrane-associated phospholipid phosphatase
MAKHRAGGADLNVSGDCRRSGEDLLENWIVELSLFYRRWVCLSTLLMIAMVTAVPAQTSSTASPASPVRPDNPITESHSSAAENTNGSTDRYALQPGEDPENRLVSPFLKHLVTDQKEFWMAPVHLRTKDLKWLIPFAGVTAAFIASDSWWTKQVPLSHMQTSLHISDYGLYSLIGLGGASFLLGRVTGHGHLEEAGLLSAEAAMNSTAVAYFLKEATQRQRPLDASGHGDFFGGGTSFPSEHSAIAWSIASVWAHEYPGWLSQTAAYGLASAITVTRVTAKQHFPSDVIVGSVLGWYVGHEVYRAHHDPEVGGSGWGNLVDGNPSEHPRNPENMASAYVPVDSWVYRQFDQLIALGYVYTAHTGIRPWSRMECARLVGEAQERLADEGSETGEAVEISSTLANEFRDEIARIDGAPNVGATLESLYTRSTQISGTSLRDGFHFGQTIINDYGRPYGTGFNNVSGVTARAVAGPVALYINGEYQHAPAAPSEPAGILQAEASVDRVPFLPPNGVPQIDRLRLLDATASFQVSNLQFTFGQQSLWLGPSAAGPLLFSNNAEPIPMFRMDSVSPYEIPLLSRLLGPARTQFFLGRLSGQTWAESTTFNGPGLPSQPWLHGTMVSFKPTPNFEFGLGFTAQFGGTGNPFTWHNFFTTFYEHKATFSPAKRLSEFNFSYRIPGLRKWLTFYTDSMVVDEYSPVGSTRPQINPGIYLPQLPKLHKMELRFEGVTTDLNIPGFFNPGTVYWDSRYRSGYTNNGNLIGNWIGRAGRAEQAWVTYSFTPRNHVQFGYRHNDVDPAFLKGGHLQDLSVRGDMIFGHSLGLSGYIQYETWNFQVLSPVGQSNVAASLELTFWPHWEWKKQ